MPSKSTRGDRRGDSRSPTRAIGRCRWALTSISSRSIAAWPSTAPPPIACASPSQPGRAAGSSQSTPSRGRWRGSRGGARFPPPRGRRPECEGGRRGGPGRPDPLQEREAVKITRRTYASHYGPTTGDRIRLGDTDLVIAIEHDATVYGDEA